MLFFLRRFLDRDLVLVFVFVSFLSSQKKKFHALKKKKSKDTPFHCCCREGGKGSCYLRICFWFKQTRLSLIKERKSNTKEFPGCQALLLHSERQSLMTIPDTKRHIFLLQSFVLVLGSLSGEWSRMQPTKPDSNVQREREKKKRKHVHEALVFMLILTSLRHNTMQHTPFFILKKKKKKGPNFERKT